jgi:hypothetical protein
MHGGRRKAASGIFRPLRHLTRARLSGLYRAAWLVSTRIIPPIFPDENVGFGAPLPLW